MTDILEIGKRAKEAAKSVNIAALDVRNAAISNIAEVIDKNRQYITEQNNIDIENAESSGMSAAMIDRLRLTDSRLDGIIKSMGKIVMYPNPIGKVESGSTLENGLKIVKTRVPLGVIGIIFESRPNVSVDAAALCIKSGQCRYTARRKGSHTLQYCACVTHAPGDKQGRLAFRCCTNGGKYLTRGSEEDDAA